MGQLDGQSKWRELARKVPNVVTRSTGTRRFATAAAMDSEIAAWQRDRNERHCGTNWRFTTADARMKLKSLYPVPDSER